MEEKVYLHYDRKDNSFWFSIDNKSNIEVSDRVVDLICKYTRIKNIRFVSKHYNGKKLYLTEKNFMDYFEEYQPQIDILETPEQKRIKELEKELSSLREMMATTLQEVNVFKTKRGNRL